VTHLHRLGRQDPEHHAAWIRERMDYITASDVAALLGESKYKQRAFLFTEKLGLADSFEGSEYTEIALRLEVPVMMLAKERYGWDIKPNRDLIVDQVCDRLAGTPDGMFESPWGLVVTQVKWTNCVATEDCKPVTKNGNPSTATYLHGPPLDYQIQLQAEMAVTGAVAGVLLVMHTTPGLKLRPYYVPRNELVIAKIRRETRKFWAEIEEFRKEQEK